MFKIIVALFFILLFPAFVFAEKVPLGGINQSARQSLSGDVVVCANPTTGILESCGGIGSPPAPGSGSASSVTESLVSVGITASIILAANATRSGCLLENHSSFNLRISFTGTAILTDKIVFPSDSFSCGEMGAFAPVTAISGISESGTLSIKIIEVTR